MACNDSELSASLQTGLSFAMPCCLSAFLTVANSTSNACCFQVNVMEQNGIDAKVISIVVATGNLDEEDEEKADAFCYLAFSRDPKGSAMMLVYSLAYSSCWSRLRPRAYKSASSVTSWRRSRNADVAMPALVALNGTR